MAVQCAICGGSIAEHQSAILLSDPARELQQVKTHYATKWGPCRFTTDLAIDESRATNQGWCFFTFDDEAGLRATACASEEAITSANSFHIPVHNYCLSLTKHILASHHARISSMRQLWKVLRMRSLASIAAGQTLPLARIDAPNDYYLPPLEAEDDHWCASDAWDIPSLTDGVLAQITPFKPPSLANSSYVEFRARFENLPQEMKDHILSSVFEEPHFPPHCTYLIPQAAWVDLLLEGRIVPYLWDLDRSQVEKKIAEGLERGIEWDFELLVRQLCQFNSMADGRSLSSMPSGLRNRQRIWKLVEDMYVGDFLPASPAAVPRYWDEEGELQHPLIWMRR